jgi:hypothetical protein
MGGTVRTFDGEIREQTRAAIEQTIAGVVSAHGAEYKLDYVHGYDAGINDAHVADVVASCIGQVHGTELVEMGPLPAGDDMTYFLQAAPGTYFFVGTRSDEAGSTYPHHHPRFTIDERSLPYGPRRSSAPPSPRSPDRARRLRDPPAVGQFTHQCVVNQDYSRLPLTPRRDHVLPVRTDTRMATRAQGAWLSLAARSRGGKL